MNQAPQNQQYHSRGHVNHISVEEAQEDPDCILGTFLVNSTPATVLFDCGALHSFVTQKFAEKCGLEPTLLRGHMAIQTLGAVFRTNLGCRKVGTVINGTSFSTDLIVLKSQGLEVILGMDWLAKHQSILDYANRTITMTSDQGVKVKYVPKPTSTQVP